MEVIVPKARPHSFGQKSLLRNKWLRCWGGRLYSSEIRESRT